MKVSTKVQKKITKYRPQGGLEQTAKIILSLVGVNHPQVKIHKERVALLAEAVAKKLRKDAKAAFFAGLLHDTGKVTEDGILFDGHNINQSEYERVKKHVEEGYEALKDHHLFIAFCAGYHHNMCYGGYGLTAKALPSYWHMGTVKKVLEISAIISICDFIDAFTHRETKIKDGSDKKAPDLKGMLYAKYPDDHMIIDIALQMNKELGLAQAA